MIIVGAGGHGKVVADIFACQGIVVAGFLDDNPSSRTDFFGLSIFGTTAQITTLESTYIVAIGNNAIRRNVAERLEREFSVSWTLAIHPSAVVAVSARIGFGTTVMAGTVINPDASIGSHTIINSGTTVDHDCVIGDFVHIAPGVHLAGNVQIDAGTLIGIGASITPGCRIGRNAVVGAGAVVISDIPDNVIAKGVPAKWD